MVWGETSLLLSGGWIGWEYETENFEKLDFLIKLFSGIVNW